MLQRYLEEMTTYTEGVLSSIQQKGHNCEETRDGAVAGLGGILFEVPASALGLEPSGSTLSLTSDMKAALPATRPSATADSPTEEHSPSRRPFQSITHQIFIHGPFVLDIPLQPAVLNKVSHGERDEFTHARYTAVACRPRLFCAEGYSLRASLFSKPRRTDILLTITLDTGECTELLSVLSRAWEAIDFLYQKPLGGPPLFDEFGWKRVILHLHCPGSPDGETEAYLDSIGARPTQWYDSGLDGGSKTPGSSSVREIQTINGKEVLWHIYEVCIAIFSGTG